LESKDRSIREAALNSLLVTSRLKGERSVRAATFAAPAGGAQRTIHNCRHIVFLPFAAVARTEDGPASKDDVVNRAFEGLGATREFYRENFDRNSIDGRGMRLDGYVHYGFRVNNAYWNGEVMLFGDGDDQIFTDFTQSLDVIGHELTHGVTEFTANLDYHKQPGALNESVSDVFGSLVKQWSLGQDVNAADWLIGREIFTPGIEADALRSMKAPGTAYDNEQFGKDPQPDHMDGFVELPDTDEGDWGGVHINSGIPNKAFYLAAMGIGGYAWEAAGHIWYASLLASHEQTQFQEFADTTYAKAGQLYGATEQSAIAEAWRQVGIRIASASSGGAGARGRQGRVSKTSDGGDSLAGLSERIEALAAQIRKLTTDVNALKEQR
jgi:Zn-dependent metalloprotease